MQEKLIKKAKEHYILGLYAKSKQMNSAAVSNFMKSLFATSDLILFKKENVTADNHTERFTLLKELDKQLYDLLTSCFNIYRQTYTKEISKEQVNFINKKVDEVFKYAKIEKPTQKDL